MTLSCECKMCNQSWKTFCSEIIKEIDTFDSVIKEINLNIIADHNLLSPNCLEIVGHILIKEAE